MIDQTLIQKYDKSNMVGSIELLGKQIEQTWQDVSGINLPPEYKNITKIVFCGMGGSALGAVVFKYLYALDLSITFEIVGDYNLPSYADQDTLVILGSYSGTTEEILSCYVQASEKNVKLVIVTAGGTLHEWSKRDNVPCYKINPKYNPCNQPRMAIGYSVFAILAFLCKLKIITITNNELNELYQALEDNNKKYGISAPLKKNEAKQISQEFVGRIPIFIAGEFLIGSAHAVRNQLNENAKSLAVYFPLPELDHHLLEALTFPKITHTADYYILFDSALYSDKIRKRLAITGIVVADSGHTVRTITAQGSNKLVQAIQTIHFGSYIGYYLALLYEIDPSPIPNVESFKKKLI